MPARVRQLLSRHGWLIAIAVAYLWTFPYFPRIQSANELPRVYLIKSIVHEGTFAIDSGVRRWGATADVSPSNGHQYSNKAPGSSLLVVPVYWVISAVAGEPSLAASMWIARVVGSIVPSLLFLVLLARFLSRYAPDPDVRRLVLVAYGLGSMAMTFSILFYSHQLSAICIASAWILAMDVIERQRGPRAMVAVGALAGAAVLCDYQTAFAGVPLTIYVIAGLVRSRPARETLTLVGLAALGAALPIAVLLWYHARCFGSPFRTGYNASQTFAHFHQQGFLGITKLRTEAFWGSMFSADNGLLSLAPWWLLAIPGGVVLWRRGRPAQPATPDRATVLVGAAMAVIFIAFVSSITFWRGGWEVGPRYIIAMLPFLLPLVAVALGWLRRWPLLCGALCGTIVSASAIYTLSAVTFPYWPDSLTNPLYEVTFRLLGEGVVAPNPLRATLGVWSLVPVVLPVGALTGYSLHRVVGVRGLLAALVTGAAILGAFALVRPTAPAHREHAYVDVVRPAALQSP